MRRSGSGAGLVHRGGQLAPALGCRRSGASSPAADCSAAQASGAVLELGFWDRTEPGSAREACGARGCARFGVTGASPDGERWTWSRAIARARRKPKAVTPACAGSV
jgi:hypothetical protein